MSDKRAAAIKAYLVDKGCNGSMMSFLGYGMGKPMADNKTKEGRAKNRRVEFKITYAQ